MSRINHVWFDFSDTIATPDKHRHDELRYSVFARLKSKADSEQSRKEYDALLEKYGGSNSNVFVQTFGFDGSFWPSQIANEVNNGLYILMDKSVPDILMSLSKVVPISVFSNIDTTNAMKPLGINTDIFTNIFSASGLQYPKPHPEGYKKIIELSRLPADEILYIGDMEQKDIIPAKSVGLKTGIIWNTSDKADYKFRNFQEILDLFKEVIKPKDW